MDCTGATDGVKAIRGSFYYAIIYNNKLGLIKMPLNGPEDLPLREGFVKTFPMMVIIRDLENDKIIRKEQIDYGKPDDRRWLGRVSYFCCSNKQSVETMSLNDYKQYEE